MGFGRGADNTSSQKGILFRIVYKERLEPGLIFWYDLSSRQMDMRLRTCNVNSLYSVGSLTAAVRELARYKLYLVGVQEVRWDKRGMVRAGDYNFYMEKEMKIINWEQDFCTAQNSVSS